MKTNAKPIDAEFLSAFEAHKAADNAAEVALVAYEQSNEDSTLWAAYEAARANLTIARVNFTNIKNKLNAR